MQQNELRLYFCEAMTDENGSGKAMERAEMKEKAKELIRGHHGMAKTVVLTEAGISYKAILAMVERGELIRIKSGYYTLPDEEFSEEEIVVSQFADGVLTMETALYYHGYLEDRPEEWSIAISKNASKSRFRITFPRMRPYYTEESVLRLGVERIEVAGEAMKIYTVDRLICDVLKYRDRMSPDAFRTAISAYIEDEGKDLDQLMACAAARRVAHKVQNILGAWIALPEMEKKTGTRKRADERVPAPKPQIVIEEKPPEAVETEAVVENRKEQPSEQAAVEEPIVSSNAKRERQQLPSREAENAPVERGEEAAPLPDLPEQGGGDAGHVSERPVERSEGQFQRQVEDAVPPEEIAANVFVILQRMELLDDMGKFVKLYDILCRSSIDGIAVSRRLIEFCEEEDFPLDEARVKKMYAWSVDRFMEQKWIRYVKRQGDLSLSWSEVINKLSSFIVPIGLSMVERKPFTGDWMPELGRFLD